MTKFHPQATDRSLPSIEMESDGQKTPIYMVMEEEGGVIGFLKALQGKGGSERWKGREGVKVLERRE